MFLSLSRNSRYFLGFANGLSVFFCCCFSLFPFLVPTATSGCQECLTRSMASHGVGRDRRFKVRSQWPLFSNPFAFIVSGESENRCDSTVFNLVSFLPRFWRVGNVENWHSSMIYFQLLGLSSRRSKVGKSACLLIITFHEFWKIMKYYKNDNLVRRRYLLL